MIETLYKTKIPQPTPFRQEFFELRIGEQNFDGQPGYFVRETQCWWDPRAKRMVRVQYTLSPREGFLTIEEARERYKLQRMNRARRGFVHSFSPCYEPPKKHVYVLIEITRDVEERQPAVRSADPQA